MEDEIINLASFEFRTDELESSIESLQGKMFDLKKRQDELAASAKALQKEENELIKAQQKLIAEGKAGSEQYNANKEALEALRVSQLGVFQSQKDLAIQQGLVNSEYNRTVKTLKTYMDGNGAIITSIQAATNAMNMEVTSINTAREANQAILAIRNDLNTEVEEEAELLRQLNEQYDINQQYIRENTSAYENIKQNIGNYTESIISAYQQLEKEKADLTEVTAKLTEQRDALEEGSSAYVALTLAITENESELTSLDARLGRSEQPNYTQSVLDTYNALKRQKEALEAANDTLREAQNSVEENSDAWKAFNQQIESNESNISRLDGQLGNTNNTVNDTSEHLEGANNGFLGFIQRAKDAGGVAPLIGTAFSAMRTGIIGATEAGLAFIATPIGATIAGIALVLAIIIGAWKFMTSSMSKTEEGTQKLNKLMAVFRGALKGLMDVLKPLAEFIFNVVVKYFDLLSEAASTAIDIVSSGLELLGFDEAAEDVKEFKEEIKANVKAAQELADAEAELAEQQRKSRLIQLQYMKDAEKLRQIRDDDSKSIKERIAANDALGNTLKKQSEDELAIARKNLQVAILRIKAEGATTEALDAKAAALVEIADIEERITGQESEQLVNRNSLIKEDADNRKEAAKAEADRVKKANEDYIKNMEQQLQKFISSQGFRRKSMEQEFKFAQDLRTKEFLIVEQSYKKRLINDNQYQIQKLEIENRFAQTSANLAVQNADYELELIKLKNQEKINENQYYSDTVFQQELDRINMLTEAEKTALKTRFDNGLINEREYGLALLKLDLDNDTAREEARATREQAIKETEAANLALQREIDSEALRYDLDAQLAIYQEGYDKRKAAAMKAGADMTLFEQNEAKKRAEIEKLYYNGVLDVASQTFGNIASILGENSKAGKAAAIAQATIDTYKAATSAYASLAIIPIVGPGLGVIAAAAAIAAGVQNVKKITAVKTDTVKKPSYRRGVIGLNGAGSTVSDSINASLSRGESVMTAASTSMYPNTLQAINAEGNGEYSSNTSVQNALLKDSVGGNMAQMIATAVAEGAALGTAKGSRKGITDLSNNREIQRNASF